jgi:hypothetical protein
LFGGNGTANLGGGGGGGGAFSANHPNKTPNVGGGSGGSGIVIIKWS